MTGVGAEERLDRSAVGSNRAEDGQALLAGRRGAGRYRVCDSPAPHNPVENRGHRKRTAGRPAATTSARPRPILLLAVI